MALAESPRLLVFARRPVPGGVKTRLCPPLDGLRAAALHAAFVADVLRSVCELRRARPEIECEVHWDRAAADGALPVQIPAEIRERVQVEGGLGRRMAAAFETAFAAGAGPVVLRNSDSPELEAALLGRAFELLDRRPIDLVLAPDPGGGYVLVGLRRPVPELFARIPLGAHAAGATVFEATLRTARRLGLAAAVLPEVPDVDRPEDLEALARRLEADPGRAPATARLLRDPDFAGPAGL